MGRQIGHPPEEHDSVTAHQGEGRAFGFGCRYMGGSGERAMRGSHLVASVL